MTTFTQSQQQLVQQYQLPTAFHQQLHTPQLTHCHHHHHPHCYKLQKEIKLIYVSVYVCAD